MSSRTGVDRPRMICLLEETGGEPVPCRCGSEFQRLAAAAFGSFREQFSAYEKIGGEHDGAGDDPRYGIDGKQHFVGGEHGKHRVDPYDAQQA